jgi:hypothetical protein
MQFFWEDERIGLQWIELGNVKAWVLQVGIREGVCQVSAPKMAILPLSEGFSSGGSNWVL